MTDVLNNSETNFYMNWTDWWKWNIINNRNKEKIWIGPYFYINIYPLFVDSDFKSLIKLKMGEKSA